MSLTYGYNLKDEDDMIAAPIQATEILSRLILPGAVMVNHLPFCMIFYVSCVYRRSWISSVRHIPSWVPWFNYEPMAQIGRKLSHKIQNDPFDFTKSAMVCKLRIWHSCQLKTTVGRRYRYSVTGL
jgi:hypothetical protein